MDILVLDIGCSRMKSVIYRGNKLLEKTSVVTPQNAEGIMKVSVDLVNKAYADGYELSGIIPTSFSESVIVEDQAGKLMLFGPVLPVPWMSGPRPSYDETGYPDNSFVGVCRILHRLKSTGLYSFRRALPVSAMVAVQLVSNTEWKTWDWMHASNTGLYGNKQWLVDAESFEDWLDVDGTVSPDTIVGELADGTPVFLGGHDSLFGIYPEGGAYVSCGTYITASQPSEFMSNPGEDVRYVQDVRGTYHRQLCFESQGELSQADALRIYEFLKTFDVKVFGSYANEMADMLRDYSILPHLAEDTENAQHWGAAQTIQDVL